MTEQYTVKRFICQNGVGGCIQQCALIGYVDANGKLVKVEGNPNSPINQGLICADRVPRIPNILYSEWQLKYPLKRVGARGENKWQRITWDQALDEIANKLLELKAKYGPETLALFEGTYRSDIYWARSRCLNLFGNPSNIGDPGTICFTHYVALHHALLGDPLPMSDLYEANCIVNGGRDFNASFPLSAWYVQARLKRKDKPPLKLIVLDPRATDIVKDADIWLQPRPGTDTIIFISWLNVIIQEKLYDREFVEKWTNAPLLVRVSDKPHTLRESDIKPGGSSEKFVVWNTVTSSAAIWEPDSFEYEPKDVKPALEGSFRVQLADGSTAECKTVWQLIVDRVKEYTPEEAERISWVPALRIREAARMYATNKPGTINWTVPQDQSGWNAIANELAKCILRAITGNLDVPGGEPLRGLGPRVKGKMAVRDCMLQMEEALPAELRRKQLGYDSFKLTTWQGWEKIDKYHQKRWGIPFCMSGHNFSSPAPLIPRAILTGKPYPIKAVITWVGNPMAWMPNVKLLYEALKSPNLELHVVLEHVMTPTAQLADYVLPIASKIERAWCTTWEDFVADMIVGEKVVEPLGERKTDFYFWRELGIRLGQDEQKYWPWKNEEEAAEYRLKPLGISLKEAVERTIIISEWEPRGYAKINPETGKPYGFATPSGKVELYSIILEELGYDPLPRYREPPESPISTPMRARQYPLILTTGGRFRPQFHSEYRQPGMGLREQHPYPVADIHEKVAKELGIANGDWVWIETARGRILQKARVSTMIHPNVVNVQHNWWFPELPGEEPHLHGAFISNANMLTIDDPETLDPISGSWLTRGLLCRVAKPSSEDLETVCHIYPGGA